MVQNPITLRYVMRFALTIVSAIIGAAIFIATAVAPARAQAFADVKMALVDYSKADIEPRKTCEAMSEFKSKEIVQITAAAIPATAAVPAYCRVTGLLQPEIAFEVSLPAKWNGRFYMIGNGGPRGRGAGRSGPRRRSAMRP